MSLVASSTEKAHDITNISTSTPNMSALRNAVQRRNHKERAQPLERSKWGLLEKHKDYSLRAKDHNAKQRKIKALQQKVSERNEDEFYFGMMSSKTRGGIKVSERAQDNSGGQQGAGKSLSNDVVKLMKTQDCAYLRTVLQSTRRAVERLESETIALEHGVPKQTTSESKTIFTDDESASDAADHELLDIAQLEEVLMLKLELPQHDKESQTNNKTKHTLEVRRRQLDSLRERQQQLTIALREVEDQRARMNGTAGGVNKNGTKFRSRQRQR